MNIYLINLDRRHDRLITMHTRLCDLGLEYSRISAVDGTGDAEIGFSDDQADMTKPEYACYLSHIKVYKAMLESDASHCLVLEDDIVMAKDFASLLDDLALHSSRNTILRLEVPFQCTNGKPVSLGRRSVKKTGAYQINRLYSPVFSSGAYVISRDIAERIVQNHSQPKIPIDHILFYKRMSHPLPLVYQVSPPLAVQAACVPDLASSPATKSDLHALRSIRYSKKQSESELPKSPVWRILYIGLANIRGNLRRIWRTITRLITGIIFKTKVLEFDDSAQPK